MLRFRPRTSELGPVTDLLAVGQLIDDAMRPGHFFVAADLRLTWIAAKAETIRWEIFRGRLLDANQTREEKSFLSWHIIEENADHPATESLISVKLDVHERRIHVTRSLLCYVQEGYDAGGGVIESREIIKWTRELVGTILLDDFVDREPLFDELICLIWQAVVGTSRLPLTSVEAPLPAFSFGQLHYLFQSQAGAHPMTSWEDLSAQLTQSCLAFREFVKALEFILRSVSFDELLRFLTQQRDAQLEDSQFWLALFNRVSLSPCTHFVDNALLAIILTVETDERIDFYAQLLHRLGRHLTAYDLVTFHHRGANYPDALLLDAGLHAYLNLTDFPEFLRFDESIMRRRRRALRQGCLLRRHYEGHLVPDAPTSPGENARVLPAAHPRVPEEQLVHQHARRRQLFANEPLAGQLTDLCRAIFAQSVADLVHLDERLELGLGVFIDRPLGYSKAIGEPDLTPLLAHEAFSPSIARRRWQELKKFCQELAIPCDTETLDPLFENGPWPAGLPHSAVAECPRPTAALSDVRKVADDFVILCTMPVGLRNMLRQAGILELLPALTDPAGVRLCVQELDEANDRVLVLYDMDLRRRAELRVDGSKGYVTRAGVELPRASLRVIQGARKEPRTK